MKDEDLMRGVAAAMREQLDAEEAHVNIAVSASDSALELRLVHVALSELKRPARRAHMWLRTTATAAMLAAALLFFIRPQQSASDLPEFEASLQGGQRFFRAASSVAQLQPDSSIEWVVRPARPLERKLVAYTFYERVGHAAESWKVKTEVSAQGSIRIRGRIAELSLPIGPLRLIAVIVPTEDVSIAEVMRRLAQPHASWRVVSTPLEVVP